MEFTLTEEQLALKRLAHEFAGREIRPIAGEKDRLQDPAMCMDWNVIRKGSKLGLRTLTIPEEYGGGGADTLTIVIVGEELGWGDLGVAYAEEYDVKLAFLTKTLCSETAFRVATMAMDILGGYGYMKDVNLEKYMRDVISSLHGAGSGDIFRMKCAALL